MLRIIIALTGLLPGPPSDAGASSRPAMQQSTMESAVMPRGIASFGAATHGGWIYVYGGHTGRAHEHTNSNVTGEFYRFHPSGTPMVEFLQHGPALQGTALVSDGAGNLYRIGGMAPLNKKGEPEDLHSTDSVDIYQIDQRRWVPGPSLPVPLSSHDAVYHDGSIYVFGGWTLDGPGRTWVETGFVYSPATPARGWTPIEQVPFRRRGIATSSHGGKIYIAGGITPDGELSHEVTVFDPATKVFRTSTPLPGAGFGAALAESAGELFVSIMDGRVLRLSVDGSAWEPVDSLMFPRLFHRMIAGAAGNLTILGGSVKGSSHARVVETVAAQSLQPQAQLYQWKIPFPLPTKNRQGMFALDYNIHIFGGNTSTAQHKFNRGNFSAGHAKIDLASLEITNQPDFPVQRQSMETSGFMEAGPAAGSKRNQVALVAGGFGFSGDAPVSQADAWIYKHSENSFSSIPGGLPGSRTQCGIVAYSGAFWIFGGADVDTRRKNGDDFIFVNRVLRLDPLDPAAGFVDIGVELPRSRRAFGITVFDGKAWLAGGLGEGFNPVLETDVFDFATKTWTTGPPLLRPRIGGRLAAIRDTLYCVGGSSPKPGSDDFAANEYIEFYNSNSGAWREAPFELPFSSNHARVFSIGSTLFVVTTQNRDSNMIQIAAVKMGG